MIVKIVFDDTEMVVAQFNPKVIFRAPGQRKYSDNTPSSRFPLCMAQVRRVDSTRRDEMFAARSETEGKAGSVVVKLRRVSDRQN